jgi:hypothetical protein
MFKSHEINSNHRVLRKNKIDTMERQFLHLIILPVFKQPKCVLTPMSILCKLDFFVKIRCCNFCLPSKIQPLKPLNCHGDYFLVSEVSAFNSVWFIWPPLG